MFTIAMSSTNPTALSNTQSMVRTRPTNISFRGLVKPTPSLVLGNCRDTPAAIDVSSDAACCGVTPGFNRPIPTR